MFSAFGISKAWILFRKYSSQKIIRSTLWNRFQFSPHLWNPNIRSSLTLKAARGKPSHLDSTTLLVPFSLAFKYNFHNSTFFINILHPKYDDHNSNHDQALSIARFSLPRLESTLSKQMIHDVLDTQSTHNDNAVDQIFRVIDSILFRLERWFYRCQESSQGRTILSLVTINAIVYSMWKVLPTHFMMAHFLCSVDSVLLHRRFHTLVTSNFSHMGFLHLSANMFLLANFGEDLCRLVTPERFGFLYLVGGLTSSVVSLLKRYLTASAAASLGASGSVMAIMVVFALFFPDTKVYLMGVYEMKVIEACVAWIAWDVIGMLRGFGSIDFAAHLGGGFFGLVYHTMTKNNIHAEARERQRNFVSDFFHAQNSNTTSPFSRTTDENSKMQSFWNQLKDYIDKIGK